jgi:AAA family ATP:ADP antiporter
MSQPLAEILPIQPRTQRPLTNRLLPLLAQIHPGEATRMLLMATNIFVLLGAYYLLKTVREALILTEGGAEVKSYSSAGQALLLLLVVPAYGALASRVNRLRLISFVTIFFALNLVLFAALGLFGIKVGVAFFLWVGIFNVLIVAQFWAFANDIYKPDEGKRLFPFIGIGSSLGAILGAQCAKPLLLNLGPYWVMALVAAALISSLLLTRAANRRVCTACSHQTQIQEEVLSKEGGFQLIFRTRYLLLIALLVLVLNIVNSTGEYVLSKFVVEEATRRALSGSEKASFIGGFYGDFFWWVNVVSFAFQTLLVARLFKWIGVGGALFILPLVALLGYSALLFLPLLPIVRAMKIAENATDYSIQSTTRQALFLPTSREAKYKAKAAIDTFFWRAGDVLQAGFVLLGVTLGFGISAFSAFNLVLVLLWLGLAAWIFFEHRKLSPPEKAASTP